MIKKPLRSNPPIFTVLDQARDAQTGNAWMQTFNNVVEANPGAVNDTDRHRRPFVHVLSLDVVQGRIAEATGREILKALIQSRVNLTATSPSGATALELARTHRVGNAGREYLEVLQRIPDHLLNPGLGSSGSSPKAGLTGQNAENRPN